MKATDKEATPSEHFDSAMSASALEQVGALGPAGLSGAQVALLALVLGGLLGIAGLTSLCLMVWFSHQRFGVDRSAKHGISVKDTSRMGGVAIALFLILVWLATIIFPSLAGDSKSGMTWGPSFLLLAGLLACIGFLDDLGMPLTPVIRLLASTLILTVGFIFVPDWMPNQFLGFFGDTSLGFEVGLVAASVFVCVGFINAGNMADGANGLFSGICLAFFVCVWFLTADNLEQHFEVVHSNNGKEAFELFCNTTFDLCVFDIMLPDMDGFEIVEEIRKRNEEIPIIFLSAKTLKEDRIKGLKLGADDYLIKPYSIEELILKIEVFLNRSQKNATVSQQFYTLGSFSFEPENYTLSNSKEKITLTDRESALLKLFLDNANRVLKREKILISLNCQR